MSTLWIMIPATLALAAALLALVLRSVWDGDLDDVEGPAARHYLDDDAAPEIDALSADGPTDTASSPGSR